MFLRTLMITLLGLLAWPAVAGVRFEPPLRDPLYFNEVLMNGESPPLPLRLPRLGRYYAELILEPVQGANDLALASPLPLTIRCTFRRNQRELGERTATVELQPGERGKTLYYFDVPDNLPHRADLTMQVRVEAPNELPAVGGYRLQIRRKIDFAPLPLLR